MKTICTICSLILILFNLHSQVTVSTQTELENAIINVQPSETIILNNRTSVCDSGCKGYGGNGMDNSPYLLDDLGVDIGIKISSISSQTVEYTPSTQIIPNPERGLQKYSITGSNYSTTFGANNLSVMTLNDWKNSSDKVRVVFRYFLLDDFMNSDINTTYLNNMQNDFDNVRTVGLKIIVRISYSDDYTDQDEEDEVPQQPTKSQILTHISQLAPLLDTNKDIIFSHQAGFIGTWGEWYYTNSDEFGHKDNISSAQWTNREEVLNAMLAATPAEIPLQVRYVGIKKQLYGTSQLTSQSAYQNTANARIGFYNDAFLNEWGDEGTYSVNSPCQNPVSTSDYNYLSNETQYLPMTGETNALNPCNSGIRSKGGNAINEMGLTNWTTINRDYIDVFWNQIIASNHYNEILRKLGYRYVMNSSTVTVNGLDFDFTIDLENIGFARAFKERDVYLIMKNTQNNTVTSHLIDTDIRTWENSASISQNISPESTGTFQLYLWMPDKATSLATNPDYSIQVANENIWEASTGYNDLMQTVSLNCAPTTGTDSRTECDSYTWIDGNTYTSSNNTATYNILGGAANGCDSLVTLDLTIINSTTGVDPRTECNSYTWLDGNTYTSSNNSATYNLIGANGCDSIVTLDLTIENSTTGTDTRTECDSYTWLDGNTYTSNNNSETYNLMGANGCDSIVTLDLTIVNSTNGTDIQTECDSFTWLDGNTYTSSNNSATYTSIGVNGCDSIVTLDLTIVNSMTGTDTRTECDSYTWLDGNTYTSSNNSATYNLIGANGCDSIVTLDLTIENSTTGTDTRTECDSYKWLDGNTYTSSNNTATYNLIGTNGCDSIVTLDLIINNVTDNTTTTSETTIMANNNVAIYQWLDCANGFSVINGETNISFTPSESGEYAVELTENNCQDTSACVAITLVGINKSDFSDQFIIFPNPADKQIFIQNPEKNHGIIQIFDSSGKILIRKKLNDSLISIKTDKISQGVYFIRIISDKGSITKKIIVS